MELGFAVIPDDHAPECVEELPVGTIWAVVVLDLLVLGVADPDPTPVPVGLPLVVFANEVGFVGGYGAVIEGVVDGFALRLPVPRGREESFDPVLRAPEAPVLTPVPEGSRDDELVYG